MSKIRLNSSICNDSVLGCANYRNYYRNSKYLNKIFVQFADSLAIAISTVINMFNPEIVIIGGKMAMLLENFLPELLSALKVIIFQSYLKIHRL